MDKSQVFHLEISQIKHPELQQWVRDTLQLTPEYFFKAAASSTGKYHPACTIKEGGLLVHVQRAVYFALQLCEAWAIFDRDRDVDFG